VGTSYCFEKEPDTFGGILADNQVEFRHGDDESVLD